MKKLILLLLVPISIHSFAGSDNFIKNQQQYNSDFIYKVWIDNKVNQCVNEGYYKFSNKQSKHSWFLFCRNVILHSI